MKAERVITPCPCLPREPEVKILHEEIDVLGITAAYVLSYLRSIPGEYLARGYPVTEWAAATDTTMLTFRLALDLLKRKWLVRATVATSNPREWPCRRPTRLVLLPRAER